MRDYQRRLSSSVHLQQAWLYWVTEKPWWTIIICVATLFFLAAGSQFLYFRADYKVYFNENNPQRLALEEMQDIFAKNENVSIVVSPKKGDIFNPTTLDLLYKLTEESWQIPLSTRVDSITNFQHTWSEDDDLMVMALVDSPELLSTNQIDTIKQVTLSEPNIAGKLVSIEGHGKQNGTVAMVNITVQLPDGDQSKQIAEITQFAYQMVNQYQQDYPEHDFYLTGVVMLNNAFDVAAKHDAATLIPLMFLTIIVIMWLLLHSVTGTIATFAIVTSAIACTMGLAGWMGFYLTTATVNVPIMVMTLAVADCIHIVALMLYQMGQGDDKKAALQHALAMNFKPVVVTSVTTVMGFVTLNFSAVPTLAELGNLTAMGVFFACLLSLTLLPAMLSVMPVSQTNAKKHTFKFIHQYSEWIIRHYRRILPYSAIIVLVSVLFAFTNNLNDVVLEYFEDDSDFRVATDFQESQLSGMSNIDFVLFSGKENGLYDPTFLKITDQFAQWLRLQPEVDHVFSFTETLKRLNKNMHNDDASYYHLPEERDLAAQYVLLYEMSLPYGMDLNNQIDTQRSSTRIMATLKNIGSKELIDLEAKAYKWLAKLAPDIRLSAASPPLMFAHIGEANMQSMIKGTILALAMISILLVFVLHSFKLGFVSLIPNLMPAGIGFGIWAVISGQINLGLSVVLSMTLGIIVDDTVHFLVKYQAAKKLGKSVEDSIRYAFTSVGKALVITTFVLAAGFSILMMSSFALNSDMGMLTAIIIVVALLTDFIFLPAFLLFFDQSLKNQHRVKHT